MNEIARDGDLGDLGRDTAGPAAGGIDPAIYGQLQVALGEFQAASRALAAAQADAERLVALTEGWVALGQRVLEMLRPVIEQWQKQRAAESAAPDTNRRLARMQGVASQLGLWGLTLAQALPAAPGLGWAPGLRG